MLPSATPRSSRTTGSSACSVWGWPVSGLLMCRSIVTLRGEEPATPQEVEAAALQFVRKIAGSRVPSRANRDIFERAVSEVAAATSRLLGEWVAPPGSRPPALAPSRRRASSLGQTEGGTGT